MIQKVQVEYIGKTGDYEVIDVVFEAEVEMENDSYTDEYGLVSLPDYPEITGEVTWDKRLFSDEQNREIDKWYRWNWREVEDLFSKQFVKDIKNHF
jgi:hypothetical protein